MNLDRNRSTWWVAGTAGAVVVALVLGTGVGRADSTDTAAPRDARNLLRDLSATFQDVASELNPTVVSIFSKQTVRMGSDDPHRDLFGGELFRRFFEGQGPSERLVRGLGSGVIVSDDGLILTNAHVVEDADELTVELNDGRSFEATIVGTDVATDVAVIRIEAEELTSATLGDSDDAQVGEWVLAVGNPMSLMHTVTAGILSAKGRANVGLTQYEDFLQTDAAINRGNSGGPLVNLDGDVIGINTAIATRTGGYMGIGFAIPINMAKRIMDQLVAQGRVSRGYLGVMPQDLDDALATALGLESSDGALVSHVEPGGPSDEAGMKRDDVIVEFNGSEVRDSAHLRMLVAQADPGSDAEVKVMRDGRDRELSVSLGDRSDFVADGGRTVPNRQLETERKMGVAVTALTPEIAAELGFEDEEGVVVEAVQPGSPAADAGLRRGDLVQEVNRNRVTSVGEYRRALDDTEHEDIVLFLVRRGQVTLYYAVKLS